MIAAEDRTSLEDTRASFAQRVDDVAALVRATRGAAVAFVAGTASGWGRFELAKWLLCHYAPCAIRARTLRAAEAPTTSGRPPVDEATIEALVRDARSRALRVLADLTLRDRASALGRAALARGHVVAVTDDDGRLAHVAVDRPRMRLESRVVAVLVADWLNHQSGYGVIRHCGECGGISFGAPIPHDRECTAEPGRHLVAESGTFRRASL